MTVFECFPEKRQNLSREICWTAIAQSIESIKIRASPFASTNATISFNQSIKFASLQIN